MRVILVIRVDRFIRITGVIWVIRVIMVIGIPLHKGTLIRGHREAVRCLRAPLTLGREGRRNGGGEEKEWGTVGGWWKG